MVVYFNVLALDPKKITPRRMGKKSRKRKNYWNQGEKGGKKNTIMATITMDYN
jgi:phosphoribosyl-AMP cyclohydrolase